MSALIRAEEIAREAHAGQTDKAGQPYIGHPLAVMANMPSDEEELRIIALLHDVLEEKPEAYSIERLKAEGFTERVLSALEAITKLKGENYWDYIRRVADNDLAVEVKLADLEHNQIRGRIPNPSLKDIARWEKYRRAAAYLDNVKRFKASNKDIALTEEPYKYILHRILYEQIRDDYVALCDTLTLALESISKPVCPSALIQGRAKKPDSFTEKCARKAEKYKKSHFKMMTDLCGTRVILQTTGQVADFCELLKQYFDIDWENSENAGARLGNDQFGY
ncbi:MAG: hypothetical protein LBS19_11805, partial [Clostridiales bacterium]|nr:hypothetical protein [Clostridiales bacterium]